VQVKRPAVLVAHTWTDVGDFVREHTTALAKMGYIAFAPDVYGKGISRMLKVAESPRGRSLFRGNLGPVLLRSRL
jgi:dienelactone hydrolase